MVIGCILIVTLSRLSTLAQQEGDTSKGPSADSQRGIQSQAAVDRATGLALQGDASGAVRALLVVPASGFQGEQASFRECMIDRFGPDSEPIAMVETKDHWIDSLIASYRKYWRRVLMRPAERVDAEGVLREECCEFARHDNYKRREFRRPKISSRPEPSGQASMCYSAEPNLFAN
jgi:hypothetical protein